MGEPADSALPPQEEAKLGAQVVAELYADEDIVEDSQANEYLTEIGWRLAAAGSEKPPDFHFYVIADPRINAFALPGGHIGVNAGLITQTHSESELASVMAHEEAHVTQRHIARTANQSNIADIATWAAVLAAIVAGSSNPNVIIGALSAGQALSYQRQVSYTREHEMEADRVGIHTLAEAGFDPMAMPRFFGALEQQERLYGSQVPELLLTHPVSTTRIAEATMRAQEYPPRKVGSSLEYDLIRARVDVLEANFAADVITGFTSEIQAGHDTPGSRYGLAYTYSETAESQKALDTIEPLVQKYPKQPNIMMLKAKVLVDLNRNREGLDLYNRCVAANPRFAPAILAYADALIQLGQPEQGREVLLAHDQNFGTQVETYRLLAQAARAMNDVGEAQFEQASYLSARGDFRGAIEQIDAGLRYTGLTAQSRDKLRASRKLIIGRLSQQQIRELNRRSPSG